MGRCITENYCRRYKKARSYITPGYDDTRILSFDEFVARYQIDPIFGEFSWYNICADDQPIHYAHYANEDYGGGTILGYYDNVNGTGFMAANFSLGTMQWSPYTFATAGADSTTDSYYNTYKIMQRYSPAADAPAAYSAYNSNIAGCAWVLPSPYHAIFINDHKNTYGGWGTLSAIWTSMEGSNEYANAFFRQMSINSTIETSKTSTTPAVLPFREYDDGVIYIDTDAVITSTGADSVIVLFSFAVASGTYDPRSRASSSYTVTLGYTDPDNHSDWSDHSLDLSISIGMSAYETGSGFSIVYPRDEFNYDVHVQVYWDANYGCANYSTQGHVTIPGL